MTVTGVFRIKTILSCGRLLGKRRSVSGSKPSRRRTSLKNLGLLPTWWPRLERCGLAADVYHFLMKSDNLLWSSVQPTAYVLVQEDRGKRRLQFLLKQAEVFQHFAPAAANEQKAKQRYMLSLFRLFFGLSLGFGRGLYLGSPNLVGRGVCFVRLLLLASKIIAGCLSCIPVLFHTLICWENIIVRRPERFSLLRNV